MKFTTSVKTSFFTSLLVALSACGGSGGPDPTRAEPIPTVSSLAASEQGVSSTHNTISSAEATSSAVSLSLASSSSAAAITSSRNGELLPSISSRFSSSSAATLGSLSSSTGYAGVSSSQASSVIASSSLALDSKAPTARIMFPSPATITEGDSIRVRGSASDNLSKIESVQVNGVEAATADNYATWQVDIALKPGLNTLSVSTRDAANNSASDVAEVSIQSEVIMYSPGSIAIDALNKRALILDQGSLAVLAVDLTTGVRKVLSSNHTPNSDIPFSAPTGIAVDAANSRALVVESDLGAVIAIDLSTGTRSVLASGGALGYYAGQRMIALDDANRRALVTGVRNDSVIAVGLDNGVISIVSGKSGYNKNGRPAEPSAIAIDRKHNRVLIADVGLRGIFAVNLSTGARSIFSDNSQADALDAWDRPYAIAVDAANNQALVVDGTRSVAVNLDTGARSALVKATEPNIYYGGMAFDADNKRALVVDQIANRLIAIDLTGGKTSIFSQNSAPSSTAYPLSRSFGIALDSLYHRALVLDMDTNGVIAVDLNTGVRSLFFDKSTAKSPLYLSYASSIAIDTKHNRALLVASSSPVASGESLVVVAINLANGAHTILSDYSGPQDIPLGKGGMVLDIERDRVLVARGGGDAGVVAVDLTSGARSLLSDSMTPNASNRILGPSGFALDLQHQRLLVEDSAHWHRVIGVDLKSGERTVVSLSSGYEQMGNESSIASDPLRQRALVAIGWLKAAGIFAVDLSNGSRQLVSGDNLPNGFNSLQWPTAICVDDDNGRALVLDHQLKALIAVDLISGERVYVSK